MRGMRFPILGTVGFWGGHKPPIAIAIPSRPRRQPIRRRAANPCNSLGDELLLTIADEESCGCQSSGDTSFLVVISTGINGAFAFVFNAGQGVYIADLGTLTSTSYSDGACGALVFTSTIFVRAFGSCFPVEGVPFIFFQFRGATGDYPATAADGTPVMDCNPVPLNTPSPMDACPNRGIGNGTIMVET